MGLLIHGGAAVALVVAVVAVAYGAGAPQLGVAEFAPAARQSLEAPPSTDAPAGGASGRRGSRSTTTTVPASASSSSTDPGATGSSPTTRLARARTCVGNPPRQIEDPQSPPCLPTIFEGDNGGATSRGVSATEIRVAVPLTCCQDRYIPMIQAVFAFANSRFELYGRRFVPVFFNGRPGDPASSRAFAAEIATQDVFAVFTSHIEWGAPVQEAFYQEMARQGVVTIAFGSGKMLSDRTLFDSLHPYVWSVYPSVEDLSRNLADFACGGLAGHPARHAGDPDLRSTTRKFGIVASGIVKVPMYRPLEDALEACAGSVPVTEATSSTSSAVLQTGIQALKSAGVTTVFCLCEGYSAVSSAYSTAAGAAAFKPEWISTSTDAIGAEEQIIWQPNISQHHLAPFGLTDQPKALPYQARPPFQALVQMAPELTPKTAQDFYFAVNISNLFYQPLLMLSSGVQGAGPTLTPETFAASLMSTQFPNAGAGAAPYWQPSVGFGPGDHSFYDDYAVVWWDDTLTSLEPQATGRGTWCYLDRGARFQAGSFPADIDQRLFASGAPCS